MKVELEKQFHEWDERIKLGLLIVSGLTLLILLVAAARENILPDWLKFRKQYARVLHEQATDERGKQIASQFQLQMEQIVLPEQDVIDRCITCHTGLQNPKMTDQPQPFTTHPGNYLAIHDPNNFGCTACHDGQGRATEVHDAHGESHHWDKPMLADQHLTTTCTRCHSAEDVYGSAGLIAQASGHESHSISPDLVQTGKRLTQNNGCLGCHMIDNKGGNLGPDLTTVGDKTHHEFDFSHIDKSEPHEAVYWLTRHFKDPRGVAPQTTMPDLGFSDREAEALTAYMLSLRRGLSDNKSADDAHNLSGYEMYSMYCAACHGANGEGSQVPDITSLTLSNTDALSVSSDDYLFRIIKSGRSGTEMPGWGIGAGGLSDDEITRIIGHMRSWDPATSEHDFVSADLGNPEMGRAVFQGKCSNCHGTDGSGEIGVSLNSPMFLNVASDDFLARTITNGRPGTAMPSWNNLDYQEVSDLLAYIRSWQHEPATWDEVQRSMAVTTRTENLKFGQILYSSNCAVCHGDNGEGGIGLTLNAANVLGAVDNNFLFNTIVSGRPSTGMPAWTNLSAEDIGAVITYIRSWQINTQPVQAFRLTGNARAGELFYNDNCLRCHGEEASGGTGPQLANPVLMDNISDAVLAKWIREGRDGTAMKGFGSDEQGLTKIDEDQIADIIAYLRDRAAKPGRRINITGNGNARHGRQVFIGSCAACHGENGEGYSGPQLRNPYFLDAASDGFLAATIALGRSGTPMEPMVHRTSGIGQISPDDVYDIIAWLRQGSEDSPVVPLQVGATEMSDRAFTAGELNFTQFCSSCHGPNGLGDRDGKEYFAPALNNPEFLNAASDGFLLATIAHGRTGTPMRSFGSGSGGIASLTEAEISDIVSFIRSWQLPKTPEEDQSNEETH